MARRPLTLALCVIARDEERFIADCLDSAKQFVDEVVVVDTGSTDRTREIAREHGARLVEFVWIDDFAAARNAAIDAARSDWILMLDADERLDPSSGPLLRQFAQRTPRHVHALCPSIENGSLADEDSPRSVVMVPRFFRRSPDVRFVSPIHEVITYLPDPARTLRSPAPRIRVRHLGYDPTVYSERKKDARNLELLEREVARGSDDPRMAFFLLQQHVIAGRAAEAVATFPAFLRQVSRLPRTFAVEGYNAYLTALTQLGDASAIELAAEEARQRGWLGLAALEALSHYYVGRGQLERAIEVRRRQLEPDVPEGLDEVDGRGGWATRLALAGLYGDAGRPRDALEELERVYPVLPTERRSEVTFQALAYAAKQQEFELAARWAPRAVEFAPDTFQDQQRLLEVLVDLHVRRPGGASDYVWAAVDQALAGDDLQQVYDLACAISPESMAGMARLLAAIERVRAADEHEAALGLLSRAMRGPKLEAVYWLLIKTLTRVGRYQDAQLAVEVLRGMQRTQKAA